MKKTRIAFILLLLLTSGLMYCAVVHPKPKSEKRRATLELLVGCIEQVHFKPVGVNDSLSNRIYTLYLKRLNRDKLYFTQEDIDKFQPYQYKIDSEITQGTFEFYDLVNSAFDKRLADDSIYAKKLLSKPIDFTVKENLEYNADKVPFPKNAAELHDRWRKLIKYEVLSKLSAMIDVQEKGMTKYDSIYDVSPMEGNRVFSFNENDREAAIKGLNDMYAKTGKRDTALKIMTYAQMEKEARAKVTKTYEDYFRDLKSINDTNKLTEYFEVIANCFDPHTDYFAPEERNNFAISMSGQLEGIGAQLLDKNGNVTVENVIPGSPAW